MTLSFNIEVKDQFYYILIKGYKTFMYIETLYRDRKHLCCY